MPSIAFCPYCGSPRIHVDGQEEVGHVEFTCNTWWDNYSSVWITEECRTARLKATKPHLYHLLNTKSVLETGKNAPNPSFFSKFCILASNLRKKGNKRRKIGKNGEIGSQKTTKPLDSGNYGQNELYTADLDILVSQKPENDLLSQISASNPQNPPFGSLIYPNIDPNMLESIRNAVKTATKEAFSEAIESERAKKASKRAKITKEVDKSLTKSILEAKRAESKRNLAEDGLKMDRNQPIVTSESPISPISPISPEKALEFVKKKLDEAGIHEKAEKEGQNCSDYDNCDGNCCKKDSLEAEND